MGTNCDRGEVDKEAWKALLIKKMLKKCTRFVLEYINVYHTNRLTQERKKEMLNTFFL